MKYELTIELTDEQNDCLLGTVAELNSNGSKTDAENYLKENGLNAINSSAKRYYDASLKRLGEAAAELPYADRIEIIATVETQIAAKK